MIYAPTKIGDLVCDMHGRSLRSHKELNDKFAIRNIVEFPLPDNDELANSQGGHLMRWLDDVAKMARRSYINKDLIVVAESSSDGWLRVAYLYDGRRYGVAEIKLHSERLSQALTEGR